MNVVETFIFSASNQVHMFPLSFKCTMWLIMTISIFMLKKFYHLLEIGVISEYQNAPNSIHLLHSYEGNMRFIPPWKIIYPEGNTQAPGRLCNELRIITNERWTFRIHQFLIFFLNSSKAISSLIFTGFSLCQLSGINLKWFKTFFLNM